MSNNNNVSPEAMVLFGALALLLFIIKIVVIIALSIAILLAVLATIVSICAWNRPIVIAGEITTPAEARAFVGGGCLSIAVTMAIALVANALGLGLTEEMLWGAALVAYLGGGFSAVQELEAKAQAAREEAERTAHQIVLPPPPAQYPPERPFAFADWDDDEERR